MDWRGTDGEVRSRVLARGCELRPKLLDGVAVNLDAYGGVALDGLRFAQRLWD